MNMGMNNTNQEVMINRMSGGMGINMNSGMERDSEFRMNPSVWEEFSSENGKRPRYPNEVFGRGGGGGSANASFGRGGKKVDDF